MFLCRKFQFLLNLLLNFSLDLVYCVSVDENAQHDYKQHLQDPQSEFTCVCLFWDGVEGWNKAE